MATELGKAYVQIIPSAKGISGSISKELGGEASSAGKSAGLNIAGAIKGAIAAAGIGTAIKAALDAGGNLQQSFGGLDTLYEDAAEGAKKYAVEASKAGISANSYAEQAVSFGAALKSAYGGDTTKAMEAANTAILDMADNSAKMGTDIGSIQTAYQGFAKQNYTMLDNLKLGYGGTKSEMERLLADASKLSGVEYNIDNLGDVYDAIHVIQEDLNLTGVAAAEASTTFSGSLGAMKAAGENLLANIALGEDITPALNTLGETVNTFVFNNLIPMLSNIVSALPNLVSGIGSMLVEALNLVGNNAGDIVKQGLDIVMALVNAIIAAAPSLIVAAVKLVAELGKALIETDWVAVGSNLISSLDSAMSQASAEIFGSDTSIIDSVLNSITSGLPSFLDKGIEIISNLVNGLLSALPSIYTTVGQLITTFVGFLMQNYPTIMQKGAELILNLVNGIISNLPQIAASVVQVIGSFAATVLSNLPTILAQGILIIGKLAAGLIQAIPTLIGTIPQIIQSIVNTFGSYDWLSIGTNIIKGIAKGISEAASLVVDAAKDAAKAAFEAAKDFLGIESPAKKGIYIGQMYDEGIALGISRNSSLVDDAVRDLNTMTTANLQTSGSYNLDSTSTDEKLDVLVSMLGNYLPQIAEKEGIDVKQLYNGINRQLGWALT